MGRWEPDAKGRIRVAAMELFAENGYENTTVAQIAERAGLTGRTFFRYFPDKREVLFGGSEQLQQTMVDAVRDAPAEAGAMQAVAAALFATGDFLRDTQAFARQRSDIVMATPELREREQSKSASLSAAVREALLLRGIEDPEASLAAETGMAVFRVAYRVWLEGPRRRDFAHVVRTSLAGLASLSRQPAP